MKFAAIDIGNSRVKFLINNEFTAIPYSDDDWYGKSEELIVNAENISTFFVSWVNYDKYRFIKRICENRNVKLKNANDMYERQDIIDISNIENIGSDRVYGLIGALNHTEPPFITVDCGTAVTVNALNKDRECIGGAIFAGIYTQMSALSENTYALKKIKMLHPKYAYGKNTADAMRSGIIYSIAGGIMTIVKYISEQEFDGIQPPVYLTGGGDKLISHVLKKSAFEFEIVPTLVLEGILAVMERSYKK